MSHKPGEPYVKPEQFKKEARWGDGRDTPCEVPLAEQCASTLEHYERLATLASEWNNQVPQAIKAWYAAKAAEFATARHEEHDPRITQPRCHHCGGFVKVEEGGICLPCHTEGKS